ncbi:hypothetical protein [Deinococcus yavapaiensis]|uniref:Uncharacterized protein n=1 Tax=Deinococcus yavapaiensis KR-236 TaxID=694435 RepID=A0A318SN14_9DEIO|nr:hypothetical protein [Deinococcus yavapaiensis]PYE56282.1 hypothetical protein DES52_10186 [Deinococcus yavapaiensis KR-236]
MRWRDVLAIVSVLLALAGCAPSATNAGTGTSSRGPVRAAFSNLGVIWTQGGGAFIALAPDFRPQGVVPSGVNDVAWVAGDAWIASPLSGVVRKVTGRPDSVRAGRVVLLSATRVYREDGSAVTYSGEPTGGLIGTPSAVVTGGDGFDYALQGGRVLRVGSAAVVVDASARGPFLAATSAGAVSTLFPTVFGASGSYRIANGRLERLDAAGVVRAGVPHEPGVAGLVAEFVVTIGESGRLRVFRYDLSEVDR